MTYIGVQGFLRLKASFGCSESIDMILHRHFRAKEIVLDWDVMAIVTLDCECFVLVLHSSLIQLLIEEKKNKDIWKN